MTSVIVISSSAIGPSGWEGGEGATQSEPLHRDPQRGSWEHAHRGQWMFMVFDLPLSLLFMEMFVSHLILAAALQHESTKTRCMIIPLMFTFTDSAHALNTTITSEHWRYQTCPDVWLIVWLQVSYLQSCEGCALKTRHHFILFKVQLYLMAFFYITVFNCISF